jgi:CDGSH-type Zn-finger protein
VRVAQSCPSGAISYERLDGGPQEAAPPVNVARVRENGPIALTADLRIGKHFLGYRATLCRCGRSANKPFCDGSHAAAEFVASGEPKSGKTDMLSHRAGALDVTPTADGPLQVEGNLEICSGTGRVVARTTQTWLCRCGASGNKPFCDGSHKKIGFRAD